jgi:hypothetical protein
MRMRSWRQTMPHVDEGIMHAYLDGALDALHEGGALPDAMTPADVIAHLDACADCRARLNIERYIREQAGEVLRAAAPVVQAPPIESLRVMRRAPAWVPYAWAASLMMAVGAGWWGSQLAREENFETRTPVMEEAAPADAVTAPITATPPPPVPQLNRTVQPPPSQQAQLDANVTANTQGGIAGNTAEKVTAPLAATGAAEASRARVDSTVVTGQVAVTPLQQIQTQQAQTQQAADAIARAQRQDFAARGAAATAPPPAAPAPTGDPAAARFVDALRTTDGLSWRTVAPGDTIQAFGMEGATRTQMEIARADIGNMVRVRQRLPDGRDVELVQWSPQDARVRRESEEARASAPSNQVIFTRRLADNSQEIIVRAGNGDVLIAIHLAGADGQSLAQRLVPLRR